MPNYFPKIPASFGCNWYHNKYPGVKNDAYYGKNPERAWEHFVNHGLGEGRDFGPDVLLPPNPPVVDSPYFGFFEKQRIVIFASYFDGLRAKSLRRDLDFLKSKGINGIRIYLNFAYPPNQPFEFLLLPSGGCRPTGLGRLQTLLAAAAEREMVVDISASRRDIRGKGFQMPMEKYRRAWINLSINLKRMGVDNYILGLENEQNLEHDGQFVMTEPQAALMRNSIKNHLPNVPIVASVANVSPGTGAAIARAMGADVLGIHDPRIPGWANNTRPFARQCKVAVGEGAKVYLQEPPRVDWGDIVKSPDDFIKALNFARNAKIAGWCFHNAGSFTLSDGSFESKLRPLGKAFLNRLSVE